ncbi:MAG: type II toxin-antitoxin system prevent-host-death family antitoxin [Elusimicrobia bacterium]|jgi:antitoxin Phd|nr:type II toxin-antitoxin system prevent-host-death family antitoxin [Elusimicrobiota bacterium]
MAHRYKHRNPQSLWQVQEAKARFSELFRKARTEGTQRVSHRGKEVIVVMAEEAYLSLHNRKSRRGTLVDFFAHSPMAKTAIDLSRNTDDHRLVDL